MQVSNINRCCSVDADDGSDQMPVPASYRLADSMGVFAEDIQLKKASFFGDEEDMESGVFLKKSYI